MFLVECFERIEYTGSPRSVADRVGELYTVVERIPATLYLALCWLLSLRTSARGGEGISSVCWADKKFVAPEEPRLIILTTVV